MSLSKLFQCLTTLMVKKKKIFVTSILNHPSFVLKQLPLVLSLEALLKSLHFSYKTPIHIKGPQQNSP